MSVRVVLVLCHTPFSVLVSSYSYAYRDSVLSLVLTNAPFKSGSGGETLRGLCCCVGVGDRGKAPGMCPLNEEGVVFPPGLSGEVDLVGRPPNSDEFIGSGERVRLNGEIGVLGFSGRGGGGVCARLGCWCAVQVELLSTSATSIRSVQSISNSLAKIKP